MLTHAMYTARISLIFVAFGSFETAKAINRTQETAALALLQEYDETASKMYNINALAEWNYNTNLTDHNQALATKSSLEIAAYTAKMYKRVQEFSDADLSNQTRRMLTLALDPVLAGEDIKNLTSLTSQMTRVYSSAKVCHEGISSNQDKCLSLDPELKEVMAKSRNYTQLRWAWQEWRNVVGRQMKPLYMMFVELKNKEARLGGYDDYGHMKRMRYESENFEKEVLRLYDQVRPLYQQLHAYVRRKLYHVYGEHVIDLKGPLPACVLGDMWGRFWTPLTSILRPYPKELDLDVTTDMQYQNMTVIQMFQLGENFFTSMGLKPLPEQFYNVSMLEKPSDREVVCHPTAWDFFDKNDFRIKMCTIVNFENLETIHHELGHTQYAMQYAHLPTVYRNGANDGFHEAIGELMATSMSTPKHLHSIGLLKEALVSHETDINFLLRTSLKSVNNLPFHLVNDLWAWHVYRGDYHPDDWNQEFWKLKEKYLGVKAPVERTLEDLDPPSIFHIANDYDMIRYFTRTILQFQFLEVLCQASGHEGFLHTCDFYGSKKAGDKLRSMLTVGRSKPWQDVLEDLTGSREMNAGPLLKYFAPLHKWLQQENAKNGDIVGWSLSQESIAGGSLVQTWNSLLLIVSCFIVRQM